LIGDTVNVAARLEGLTKQYGVEIMVGEAMARELSDFALFEIDQVRVVGRDSSEKVFVLLGDVALADKDDFAKVAQAHAKMLASYRSCRWDDALQALAKHQAHYAQSGISKLAHLFENRIARLKDNPPPSGWDGVFKASEK
jgi:adenylate cyclase